MARPAGRVFVLRSRSHFDGDTTPFLRLWRGRCWSGQRGTLVRCSLIGFRDRGTRARPCRSGLSYLPSRRPRHLCQISSSSTGSADSPRTGREYVTILASGAVDAGSLDQHHRQSRLRLSGGSRRRRHTWSLNSRENQLTPWSNDPVTDRAGEAIYVRDDDTASCGVPRPCRSGTRPRQIRRPPREGIQPVRAYRTRYCARSLAIRATRRSDQDLAAQNSQHVEPHRGSFRSPRMWNGFSVHRERSPRRI